METGWHCAIIRVVADTLAGFPSEEKNQGALPPDGRSAPHYRAGTSIAMR